MAVSVCGSCRGSPAETNVIGPHASVQFLHAHKHSVTGRQHLTVRQVLAGWTLTPSDISNSS